MHTTPTYAARTHMHARAHTLRRRRQTDKHARAECGEGERREKCVGLSVKKRDGVRSGSTASRVLRGKAVTYRDTVVQPPHRGREAYVSAECSEA